LIRTIYRYVNQGPQQVSLAAILFNLALGFLACVLVCVDSLGIVLCTASSENVR